MGHFSFSQQCVLFCTMVACFCSPPFFDCQWNSGDMFEVGSAIVVNSLWACACQTSYMPWRLKYTQWREENTTVKKKVLHQNNADLQRMSNSTEVCSSICISTFIAFPAIFMTFPYLDLAQSNPSIQSINEGA